MQGPCTDASVDVTGWVYSEPHCRVLATRAWPYRWGTKVSQAACSAQECPPRRARRANDLERNPTEESFKLVLGMERLRTGAGPPAGPQRTGRISAGSPAASGEEGARVFSLRALSAPWEWAGSGCSRARGHWALGEGTPEFRDVRGQRRERILLRT